MAERVGRGRRAVRLVEPGADGVTWWCEVRGVAFEAVVDAAAVPPGAARDSWWEAEVALFDDDTAVVLRLVRPFEPHADDTAGDTADAADAAAPAPRDPRRPRVERVQLPRGTVVLAHIGFTGTPGRDDANRWGKDRPCVVLADHGEVLELQPLFSGVGRGRVSVKDWHAARLDGPTTLDARTCFVPPEDLGPVIGRLTDRDLPSLNPPRGRPSAR